jgi:hypothetical protein
MVREFATLDRRSLLLATGVAGATLLSGCLTQPSSGGPSYESLEIDDGPVFEPGLADETQRNYYAGLVGAEAQVSAFDTDLLAGAAADFVTETDFDASYLGVIQVGAVDPAARCDVVDIHASDETLTVVVAVRAHTPGAGDRAITTLVLRVARDSGVPNAIAVELDIGDHHLPHQRT